MENLEKNQGKKQTRREGEDKELRKEGRILDSILQEENSEIRRNHRANQSEGRMGQGAGSLSGTGSTPVLPAEGALSTSGGVGRVKNITLFTKTQQHFNKQDTNRRLLPMIILKKYL